MLKVYKLEDYYERYMHGPSQYQSNKELQDVIKCPGAQLSGINTIGFLSRLELYVSEKRWFEASFR